MRVVYTSAYLKRLKRWTAVCIISWLLCAAYFVYWLITVGKV